MGSNISMSSFFGSRKGQMKLWEHKDYRSEVIGVTGKLSLWLTLELHGVHV